MSDKRLKQRGTKNGRAVWSAVIPLSPKPQTGNDANMRFTFVGTKKRSRKGLSH